jgi:hypothetical protein
LSSFLLSFLLSFLSSFFNLIFPPLNHHSGVEFSAELADFIERDIKRLYPAIAQHMRVSLVEGSTVLGQFHESLRHFALSRIAGRPYMKVIRDHVTAVHADRIELKSGAVIPCGLKVPLPKGGNKKKNKKMRKNRMKTWESKIESKGCPF